MKYILGAGRLLTERMLIIDGLTMMFREFQVGKNPRFDHCATALRKEQSLSIEIFIHKTHRRFTEGRETVPAKGQTVGQCIEQLIKQYPEMRTVLFDEKGKLKNTVEIYLNMESTYPDELKKPVKDGDKIHIALMLAGG